jgi:hypothetical protein
MTDPFRAAKLARKQRTKWWREHIPLAYAIVLGAFGFLFLVVHLIDRRLPGWLTALGVSPSGVNLLIGTAWCGLGAWGLRTKGNGTGLTLLYVLCLLGGVLTLATALGFF